MGWLNNNWIWFLGFGLFAYMMFARRRHHHHHHGYEGEQGGRYANR